MATGHKRGGHFLTNLLITSYSKGFNDGCVPLDVVKHDVQTMVHFSIV
jgi:hypothetical protein